MAIVAVTLVAMYVLLATLSDIWDARHRTMPTYNYNTANVFLVLNTRDIAVLGIDLIVSLTTPGVFTVIAHCGVSTRDDLRELGVPDKHLVQLGDTCDSTSIIHTSDDIAVPPNVQVVIALASCANPTPTQWCPQASVNITTAFLETLRAQLPDHDVYLRPSVSVYAPQGRAPACQIRRIIQGILYGLIPRLAAWPGDPPILDESINTSVTDALAELLLNRGKDITITVVGFRDDHDVHNYRISPPTTTTEVAILFGCVECNPLTPLLPIGMSLDTHSLLVDLSMHNTDIRGMASWLQIVRRVSNLLMDTQSRILVFGELAQLVVTGLSTNVDIIVASENGTLCLDPRYGPPVSIMMDSECDAVVSNIHQICHPIN